MNRPRVTQATGLLGIAVTTVTLIVLTWMGTLSATRSQRAEAEARIAANAANQAMVFEQQVRIDLLGVDQSLRILAHVWQVDPGRFHLTPWDSHLVLLNEISPDVFITDERGTVRDSTSHEAIGSNVGSRDYFRELAARSFHDDGMFIGPSTIGAPAGQWHMDLARPLRNPDGSFAGVIVAGLRTDALGSFHPMANIGSRGIIAVVGLEKGRLRFAVGPNPIDPGRGIAGSDMFKAMTADANGIWVGHTAFDGNERVHGFRRVANRNLAVVVAVDRHEAMHATNVWIEAAYIFTGGITALLLLLSAIVMHAFRAAHRREAVLSHERAVLAAANSELEQAKARADDKTVQLEAALTGMTDGIAMIDGNMRLVEWNARFPEIASVPPDMLRVGLPMEDIVRAQVAAGVFGNVDLEAEVARRVADLRAGRYARMQERTRPDGRLVELRRNRLPDGGFVTLYTDVTERRESVNALREANALAESATKAMSRFVAIVSHEIRAPLNALLNSLLLLANSGMAATQQALLGTAQRSGDALLALINDILEMSRMEASQLVLHPRVFALRPLIESTLEMFGAQAAERRITLRASIAPGAPVDLFEDPDRLRQVLINLLSNAVKFAAPGEVRVIAAPREEGGERRIRLAVRDRGPVIPDDARARLFQPFCRLEDGDAPAGTGLGLTICRHLVALMGGEIGCSVWTVGSCNAGNEFWLTLPIRPVPTEQEPAPSRQCASPAGRPPRTRILLVEDIPANQLVTAALLRRQGHLVDVVSNGPEAISAAASRPYDLILMDIFMPGMSGLEATRRIRSIGGPAAAVPIIALTASICPEDQASCAAAGMDGVLGKPAAPRELLDAIAQHVWLHRPDHPPADDSATKREATAPEVLSSARLDELRDRLPAATLAHLVEECLIDLSERLTSLHEAVRQQDGDQVIVHAHAMAGIAAEYGMAILETRLRALMQTVRQTPDSTAALAQELEAELSLAAAALRDLFPTETV